MGDDETRIRAAIESMLPGSKLPWVIEVKRHRHGGGWTVELSHEASTGVNLHASSSEVGSAIEWIIGMLKALQPELLRVATAPRLTHPDVFMEVRTLAHIFNWSRLEVRAVVRLVERWGLSSEEAEWLISEIGRDGHPPTPSRDF